MYVPKHLRGSAIALLSLLRNEGGSVGTSMSQTIQERRDQFHLERLNDNLDLLNPYVTSYLEQAQAFFYHMTGDPEASKQMALQGLANLRQQQALSLAYFDVFWLAAVLGIALVPLVLLMKRTVAEKGAHVAAD
jgi:DHA2 family multidrug resistance protein